jgi:hypothetical protein
MYTSLTSEVPFFVIGYQICEMQKPNADKYYKRMIEESDLPSDIKVTSLSNKARAMRDAYKKAVIWSNQTGQGVKETDGDSTFQGRLQNPVHMSFFVIAQ